MTKTTENGRAANQTRCGVIRLTSALAYFYWWTDVHDLRPPCWEQQSSNKAKLSLANMANKIIRKDRRPMIDIKTGYMPERRGFNSMAMLAADRTALDHINTNMLSFSQQLHSR